nr:hypothetical protein [Rhodococcus wratislaviensis]GLK38668.1 hypothetical protein GCM10017611_55350 [Rhodococcus wratislaviensis]
MRPYFKGYQDVPAIAAEHGLKAADLGLWYALMAKANEKTSNGIVYRNDIRSVAADLGYYAWKSSLDRLAGSPLLDLVSGGARLDWDGQTTRDYIDSKRIENTEKQRVTRENNAKRQVLHDAGDHTLCRKPYCELATRWARGKKPKSCDDKKAVSPDDSLEYKNGRTSTTLKDLSDLGGANDADAVSAGAPPTPTTAPNELYMSVEVPEWMYALPTWGQ